jgi:crossover junction endodeoxyribonuclease RuvC
MFIEAGIMSIKSTDNVGALYEIKKNLDKLITKHKPDVLAIEKLFFAKNQKTALAVAEARGVILLAAREHGIRIREYAPNEVKIGVTGYGAADKKAVLKMVRLILQKPGLSVIDDASDALALAILAANERIHS